MAKKIDLWMAFVDLEKAFDRVPLEVLWWALRRLFVDEWLVTVIQSMYDRAVTAIKVNGGLSKEFPVKVRVHQGSVLSPLLFIIVMEEMTQEFKVGLPWKLLYANDLVLLAESENVLQSKIHQWRSRIEQK